MITRALGAGLVAGALCSLLPLEALVLVSPVLLAWLTLHASRQPGSARLRFPAFAVASAGLALFVATQLPYKFEDRTRLELAPGCYSVTQIANAVGTPAEGVPIEAQLRQVCLSTVSPTVREVQAALTRQAGISLGYGFCGNGASAMFGATPMGRPTFTALR